MIGLRELAYLLPVGAMAQTAAKARAQEALSFAPNETFFEFFQRLQDELLWPRILVRVAPPPDEVQPPAPDRLRQRAGRRTFS